MRNSEDKSLGMKSPIAGYMDAITLELSADIVALRVSDSVGKDSLGMFKSWSGFPRMVKLAFDARLLPFSSVIPVAVIRVSFS